MIDLALVGFYLGGMLWVGWRSRQGSPDAYWVAERRYGALPLSASLVGTIFGASSTVGIVGLGYARGLTGAWWALVGGVVLVPFALFVAPQVRNLEVYTLPDILRRAYGSSVAVPGALLIALAWCGVVAAQMVAAALLLESVFQLPFQGALAIVSAVFVAYSFWGGQISVIRTDSWQLALFAGALLTALALVLGAVPGRGGFAGMDPDLLAFPVSSRFGWYELLAYYGLVLGLPYLAGPDIYSRTLSARDEATARNASLLAAGIVIPVSLLLALLGLFIHVVLPGLPAESGLPAAIRELAPPGLRGLITVGFLAAFMSSADTTLLSASTILSLNVVSPLGHSSRERELRLTRGLLFLVGGIAWAIAATRREIIASLLLAYTIFAGGVGLPTLASFWRERLGITSTGALSAVLLGGIAALLGEVGRGAPLAALLGQGGTALLETCLGPRYGSILPVIVSLIALLGVSRVERLIRA